MCVDPAIRQRSANQNSGYAREIGTESREAGSRPWASVVARTPRGPRSKKKARSLRGRKRRVVRESKLAGATYCQSARSCEQTCPSADAYKECLQMDMDGNLVNRRKVCHTSSPTQPRGPGFNLTEATGPNSTTSISTSGRSDTRTGKPAFPSKADGKKENKILH